MNRTLLSSITYWNQFLRYSEEHDIPLDYDRIDAQLASYGNEDFVPFELFKDLVYEIWQHSNTPSLGLDFADRIQLTSHGSLGFAVSHGVDLKECLSLIMRYYQTRLQAIKLTAEQQGDDLILSLQEACDWEPIRVLLYEVILYSLVNVIEFVIGKEVALCDIQFPYDAPTWANKYAEQLPCTYSFGHEYASITIPAKLLKIKSITSNRQTVSLAASQCDAELARLKNVDSLSAKIIDLIKQDDNFALTAEEIAKHLNLSKSTLSRRLKSENTGFSEIITELKKQHAKTLLLSTNDSIESIALSLNYEDTSNFNRSFKRWYDCSPSEYRSQNSLRLVPK